MEDEVNIVWKVANVEEAVDLAERFQKVGRYSLFRGQTQNYPLCSSLCRLTDEKAAEADQQYYRFCSFLASTPGLEAISKHENATSAIAQHYGLPTNYIDFTTSPAVAGFFASDWTRNVAPAMESCIMCLDPEDLQAEFEALLPLGQPPFVLTLDVPDLWRLEAQQGVFLFCNASNLEEIYRVDRILFPYTGPYSKVSRPAIYPIRKSSLEILLDHFFLNERLREGAKHERGWITTYHHPEEGAWNDQVYASAPTVIESWRVEQLGEWLRMPAEPWPGFAATHTLRVDLRPHHCESPQSLDAVVRPLLAEGISKVERTQLTRFEITLESTNLHELQETLQTVWDGMRRLPYTESQCVTALARCVALWATTKKYSRFEHRPIQQWTSKEFHGEIIYVDFDTDDGAYSKAYVPRDWLERHVNPDLWQYAKPEYEDRMKDWAWRLRATRDPSRVFDFEDMVELFAAVIIPYQALFRQGMAIFYSPARLRSFGFA
jgi:hypothetical protein